MSYIKEHKKRNEKRCKGFKKSSLILSTWKSDMANRIKQPMYEPGHKTEFPYITNQNIKLNLRSEITTKTSRSEIFREEKKKGTLYNCVEA